MPGALKNLNRSDPAEGWPTRPGGALIWVHCPRRDRIDAVGALVARMQTDGDAPHFLVTLAAGGGAPNGPPPDPIPGLTLQPEPPDQRAALRAFVDHWQPDLVLWLHEDIAPGPRGMLDNRGTPIILAEVHADRVGQAGGRWWPLTGRSGLSRVRLAHAVDAAAAQRLQRAGLDPGRIVVTGLLDTTPPAPPCKERVRADMAATLGPRPVWLAADVTAAEVQTVLAAHRQASRMAHRLLLILVPGAGVDPQDLRARIDAAGLTVSDEGCGTLPEPATQVHLAAGGDDMGLWFRIAPLTFLGGSLSGPGPGSAPLAAAALGSVVLHGPRTGAQAAALARLGAAGACRQVRSGVDLGNAIEVLLQPDRTAAMAHAAWDVTSRGAVATDRLIAALREALDIAGAGA